MRDSPSGVNPGASRAVGSVLVELVESSRWGEDGPEARARFTSLELVRGRRIELAPSAPLASESRVSARVRTVYSISALAFVLVGEYEWDPDESDFDFSFSIRYRV